MTGPWVAGVSPTMTRIVVVLPAPLGPRKPVTRARLADEGDVVDGGEAAVLLGESVDFDHAVQPAASPRPAIGPRDRVARPK